MSEKSTRLEDICLQLSTRLEDKFWLWSTKEIVLKIEGRLPGAPGVNYYQSVEVKIQLS